MKTSNIIIRIVRKLNTFLFRFNASIFKFPKQSVQEFIHLKKHFETLEPQIDGAILEKISFFKNLYENSQLRILIQVPTLEFSPGGFSIFSNMIENLNHMGIPAKPLFFNDDTKDVLDRFKPNILLSSDHKAYLDRIDWDTVNTYKQISKLKVGLTASLEAYGNSPLASRLEWANDHQIDFFYNFRAKEYTDSRAEYHVFREFGYSIINMEFGVNLLKFSPQLSLKKPYDYLFFGSVNPDKSQRYSDYFGKIHKNYKGMIYGPGWPWAGEEIPLELQKYYYGLAKVGLNLHLPEQIEWACELNERTYILGICKIPQLIDRPALLLNRYSENSMFIATDPEEYLHTFQYILANPELAKEKAEYAFMETLEKHTSFHRLESFIKNLESL